MAGMLGSRGLMLVFGVLLVFMGCGCNLYSSAECPYPSADTVFCPVPYEELTDDQVQVIADLAAELEVCAEKSMSLMPTAKSWCSQVACDDGDPCTTDCCWNGQCVYLPGECEETAGVEE